MKIPFICLITFFSQFSWAMPIATETALPVARDQGVLRIKSTVNSDQRVTTHLAALAYGLHQNTALISILPYKFTKETSGLTDIPILLRQTLIQSDRILQTMRLGGIAGLELPTWSESNSKKNVGIKGGGVFTFQTPQHEFDADFIYTRQIPSAGLTRGDSIAYDLAYQVCVCPWRDSDAESFLSQWNLDFELNGLHESKDKVNGVDQTNTGGGKLYSSVGLQWVTQTKVLEALYQIPILNRLNGNQPLSHQFVLSLRTLLF